MEGKTFPAKFVVHTPSGPSYCCRDHANKSITLFNFLGAHVHVVDYFGDEQCKNCINEAERKAAKQS